MPKRNPANVKAKASRAAARARKSRAASSKMASNRTGRNFRPARPYAPPLEKRYMDLIGDPCGADLTTAPYTSTGSGITIRTRTIQLVASNASPTAPVDVLVQLTPTPEIWDNGTLYQESFLQNISVTAAQTMDSSFYNGAPQALATYSYYRPVAACLEISYSGTELNRGGTVYSALTNRALIVNGHLADGSHTAGEVAQGFTRFARLGDERHQVRFAPSLNDQNFTSRLLYKADKTPENIQESGAAMLFAVLGATGAFTVTATVVWEVVPDQFGGVVSSIQSPAPTTVQAAISKIKDLSGWATSPAGEAIVSGIKSLLV
jgi:hypothetical protein